MCQSHATDNHYYSDGPVKYKQGREENVQEDYPTVERWRKGKTGTPLHILWKATGM